MSLNDVLLDPSLMVSDKELAATETRIERYLEEEYRDKEFRFHVPSAFVQALEADDAFEDTAVYNFYSISDTPAEAYRIQEFLDQYDNQIQIYSTDNYYIEGYEGESVPVTELIRDELSYYGRFDRTEQLAAVLGEEFVFMNEESIISAETDKQVQKFKEIGSAVIDVSRTAFETVVSRSLNIDEDNLDEGEEILNRANVLRTFGKFTIIGGSSVAGTLSGPLISALAPTIGGIILLIDPESEEPQ
jgi:hypothetical protein